jgi:hypothetical protein
LVSPDRDRKGAILNLNERKDGSCAFISFYPPLRETPYVLQVRGPLGCGKTALMHLLHAHILRENPGAFARSLSSWPPDGVPLHAELDACLGVVDPLYPRDKGPVFILFDDGHDTYPDERLWMTFFKRVATGHSPYRIALFCRDGGKAMSTWLSSAARISLRPHPSRWSSGLGLLLTWPEFREVVFRFHQALKIDGTLMEMIFVWTSGHVGAVRQLLDLILVKVRISSFQISHIDPTDLVSENTGYEKRARADRVRLLR